MHHSGAGQQAKSHILVVHPKLKSCLGHDVAGHPCTLAEPPHSPSLAPLMTIFRHAAARLRMPYTSTSANILSCSIHCFTELSLRHTILRAILPLHDHHSHPSTFTKYELYGHHSLMFLWVPQHPTALFPHCLKSAARPQLHLIWARNSWVLSKVQSYKDRISDTLTRCSAPIHAAAAILVPSETHPLLLLTFLFPDLKGKSHAIMHQFSMEQCQLQLRIYPHI